ncbi:MAG: glycosyltransferase family 2 protein [Gammaproteobacteria bacterium]|nr:glycosyltransferase family 2 protein [Gammaproteobacteria bacterium]
MIESLFWLSVVLVLYPYLIYPAIIKIIAKLNRKTVARADNVPNVTVLIAAYNEADCIELTMQKMLAQNYPKQKLEIIVVSDGSEDGTDTIVESYASQGVRLIRQEPRRGKAAALNLGVKQANGEILVFADANSQFTADALSHMVKNFADPSVGYITGTLRFLADDGSVSGDGCSAYMKFENFLRKLETDFGSVIGVNGGVDAIRKSLYTDIREDLITDFVLPLHVISQNHRVIYDEQVISYEMPNSEMEAEFRMRVRVALRALQGLRYMQTLLNPARNTRIAFSIISHKLIRYLAPIFMLAALLFNLLLALSSTLYTCIFAIHLLIYAAGAWAAFFPVTGTAGKLLTIPAYFLATNSAFMIALIKYVKGEKMATWKPRAG